MTSSGYRNIWHSDEQYYRKFLLAPRGLSLPCLRTQDIPLDPPSTPAKMLGFKQTEKSPLEENPRTSPCWRNVTGQEIVLGMCSLGWVCAILQWVGGYVKKKFQ